MLEYGGALSGEHGDGLVRAPFQEKMFGPELYNAFCEVKSAFDPTNLLNPGKIVHAPALTSNLRFEPAVGQGDMSEQEFPDAVRSGADGDGTGRVDEEREYATGFDFFRLWRAVAGNGTVHGRGSLPQDSNGHHVPVLHGYAQRN